MKISYEEYLQLVRDPEISDEEIARYSMVRKGPGGLSFTIYPDPKKVEMTDEDMEFENAMQIGNNAFRYRRQARFRRRLLFGSDLPVLVSEGDSWFQFPLLIQEVIDQLGGDYLIWSVGAAGDTAQNMVFAEEADYKTEYMTALKNQKKRVKGFLFSAAGNDIIGEDPATGDAALFDILRPFNGDTSDVTGHVDIARLGEKIAFLRKAYRKVIRTVRAEPGFKKLPIFVHGYDYVFPYPWPNDPRKPSYAKKDEWLGEPLAKRGINDPEHRRAILKFLIDALYDMLDDIAAEPDIAHVHVIDCRGAMPAVSDWNDEIHGTSKGFAKVAARFDAAIKAAL